MKNLVWITIDSLRADFTSFSDETDVQTPSMADLGDAGLVFENCFSSAIKTFPSVGTMLTGTQPSTHGLCTNPENDVPTLDPTLETLPERLGTMGFRTAGVSQNVWLSEQTGLAGGFDEFTWFPGHPKSILRELDLREYPAYIRDFFATRTRLARDFTMYSTAPPVTRRALLYLRDLQTSSEPFFLTVHFNESHRPYDPPWHGFAARDLDYTLPDAMAKRGRIDDDLYRHVATGNVENLDVDLLRALYAAEVEHVDAWLGRLLSAIDLAETVVVVTGDHGEYFGEYGLLGHQLLARDPVTHVPLIVAGLTDEAPIDPTGLVQHVDVVRTVLADSDIEFGQCEGIDLRRERREAAYTEWLASLDTFSSLSPAFDPDAHYGERARSVRTESYRYIEDDTGGDLYKPGHTEQVDDRDLLDDHAALVTEFRDLGTGDSRDSQQVTDELREQLEELGYL